MGEIVSDTVGVLGVAVADGVNDVGVEEGLRVGVGKPESWVMTASRTSPDTSGVLVISDCVQPTSNIPTINKVAMAFIRMCRYCTPLSTLIFAELIAFASKHRLY